MVLFANGNCKWRGTEDLLQWLTQLGNHFTKLLLAITGETLGWVDTEGVTIFFGGFLDESGITAFVSLVLLEFFGINEDMETFDLAGVCSLDQSDHFLVDLAGDGGCDVIWSNTLVVKSFFPGLLLCGDGRGDSEGDNGEDVESDHCLE